MITNYVIKRSETDYVVNCDAQGNGGYNAGGNVFIINLYSQNTSISSAGADGGYPVFFRGMVVRVA